MRQDNFNIFKPDKGDLMPLKYSGRKQNIVPVYLGS